MKLLKYRKQKNYFLSRLYSPENLLTDEMYENSKNFFYCVFDVSTVLVYYDMTLYERVHKIANVSTKMIVITTFSAADNEVY